MTDISISESSSYL